MAPLAPVRQVPGFALPDDFAVGVHLKRRERLQNIVCPLFFASPGVHVFNADEPLTVMSARVDEAGKRSR